MPFRENANLESGLMRLRHKKANMGFNRESFIEGFWRSTLEEDGEIIFDSSLMASVKMFYSLLKRDILQDFFAFNILNQYK